MTKYFFSFLTFFSVISGSFGQACGTTSSCVPKPATGNVAFFDYLSDSLLPCFSVGWSGSQNIYIENYTTINLSGINLTINSLRIDSIENLPKGLCWKTNKANNTWNGGQTGCIEISGTVSNTNAAGQYKLRIIATLATSAATLPLQDMEALADLRYYLRVNCPAQSCPNIDTILGKTQSFIAYSGNLVIVEQL